MLSQLGEALRLSTASAPLSAQAPMRPTNQMVNVTPDLAFGSGGRRSTSSTETQVRWMTTMK
jgi:hypothetical protein